MTVHRVLGAIANSFNPILAILALAVPFVRKPRTLRSTTAYYLAAGMAIGLVYIVRAIVPAAIVAAVLVIASLRLSA
ncbi:MAG TPA: hypothetical protein VGQ46_10450 [Thermoanaerobaculia bacterium]|nr:hypothetical protein [Thermoanaerobaculia bacterium]